MIAVLELHPCQYHLPNFSQVTQDPTNTYDLTIKRTKYSSSAHLSAISLMQGKQDLPNSFRASFNLTRSDKRSLES